MILKRLTLVNFGIYRGLKEFDLRPERKQPIVIVGGKNGTGKTTLLEAIRLCLYGPLALEQRRPSKAEYEQYLGERIHQQINGDIPIDTASVALEFEYALAGEVRTYSVKREWRAEVARFKEDLLVLENGKILSDTAAEQWQDFLQELIPPGLSQLFFFDGEKIQGIAEDGPNNWALAKAIKALLGLDVVEQLQTDLNIYRRRQQEGGNLKSTERQIEVLQAEMGQLGVKIEQFKLKQSDLESDRNQIDEKIQEQEVEIKRLGGSFAQQRDGFKSTKIQLTTEIEQLEQNIRELCGGLFPFAVATEQTMVLKKQLLREAEYQRWEVSKAFIKQKLDVIRAEMRGDEFWQGTGAEIFVGIQQAVEERVIESLQRLVDPPQEIQQTKVLHQVSEPEQRQLLQWIAESQDSVPADLKEQTARLGDLKERRQRVEEDLHRVPNDDVLAPLMETLNQYQQALGAVIKQQEQLGQQLHSLEFQEQELIRQETKAEAQKGYYEGLSSKIQRIVDVEVVLSEFRSKLMSLRIKQLEESFVRNFNRLCRKAHLLESIKIKADDFSVRLMGLEQQEIPKRNLSAGEKQIYAIAMLWALRQVSGRPLPLIIDTPLGRLDSDHRHNLIKRYFPHASHQVILFSTDTEVDARFFAAMQPAISRAYHLEHDPTLKATEVSEGYFWSDNGKGVV